MQTAVWIDLLSVEVQRAGVGEKASRRAALARSTSPISLTAETSVSGSDADAAASIAPVGT